MRKRPHGTEPDTGATGPFPWNRPVVTRGPGETRKLAGRLVAALGGPAVIALYGEMGSGKTCFVQGLAMALGIGRLVTSPTFTVVNEYRGALPLVHVDLYRISDPDEILALGFEECLESPGIVAVEWAERAGDLVPPAAVRVRFEPLTRRGLRRITVCRS
jgi:tRNA threonylcarbamoyladenosine biosynthesis protein TsaE